MKTGSSGKAETWELKLERQLAVFGHRNWVVVADSAYPAQSNPGIETIVTGADHIEVLQKTLNAISRCRHVRCNAYIDAELKFVPEEDAVGVSACRDTIRQLLRDSQVTELEHERIITKLDEGGSLFRILILKSTLAIPYSSVFLQLDCGYWTVDAEKRLREAEFGASLSSIPGLPEEKQF